MENTTWNISNTSGAADDFWQPWYLDAEHVLDRYVTHYICIFGILGNFVNLIVLTRKSIVDDMPRLEKSAHVGLIALAVSDFFFCLCNVPQAYKDPAYFSSPTIDFWLVYKTYSNACINIFLLISSWLTVAMAMCRYLAICHPLKARQYLGMTATRIIMSIVFITSIIFNLPRFWMYEIKYSEGLGYFPFPAYMKHNTTANEVYMWLYFVFGILLPLLVLAYCNIYLVKALHESSVLRRQHSRAASSSSSTKTSSAESTRVVTLTLCIIVVMYIVLVGPAEIVTFWEWHTPRQDLLAYGLAVKICNALQMLNFAVNFILYCIINVHFRRVIRELLLCRHLKEHALLMRHERESEEHERPDEGTAML